MRTGNLVYVLFQHDTSRALDPQGHVHVLIANMTKMANGAWRALHNGQLWKTDTTIGAACHAQFRAKLAKLGYETSVTGKHEQFEINGREARHRAGRRSPRQGGGLYRLARRRHRADGTAAARPEPIPAYAEMSSINPALLFFEALTARGAAIAHAFVPSLNLGAGQFCTNPGLLLAIAGPNLDAFVAEVEQVLSGMPASTMLTPGIHAVYAQSVAELVGQGPAPVGRYEAHAHVFEATA